MDIYAMTEHKFNTFSLTVNFLNTDQSHGLLGLLPRLDKIS